MSQKAFVYTELQISIPFASAPWREINPELVKQHGFRNKTWLSGVKNKSVGGFYEFDSVEHAQQFVTGYFPAEARKFDVAQTTRVFDGSVVEEASRYLNSLHFNGTLAQEPQAFVYTEAQIAAPFALAPWREMNPILKAQPGLLHKTWLSGVNTSSVGGFYAFDTIENATRFVTDYFPTEAAGLNVAYTTRIFDAAVVKEASLPLNTPYFRQ
ncbi:MAG: YdhR family protein [Bryobacteraceae bacterium]|nr:YdhR family protein [Bryobacteraceae bacterium]